MNPITNTTTYYYAVSYVWGPLRNLSDDLDEDEKLPLRDLPTIEDVIKVMFGMRGRLLWVDRYCIRQRHNEQKQLQLSQMANIYEHAIASIVCLGSRSDTGIPSISSPLGEKFLVDANSYQLTWLGPSLKSSLQNSDWNSRGWTYQEALLSTRCIISTNYDLFLACQERSVNQSTRSSITPKVRRLVASIHLSSATWPFRQVMLGFY